MGTFLKRGSSDWVQTMINHALSVYGIGIRLESHLEAVVRDFEHDFGYFSHAEVSFEEGVDFQLSLLPESSRPKSGPVLMRTRRSKIYFSSPQRRRLCFFNRAWVDYHFEKKKCEIYCDDAVIAYEAVYLVVLSFLGESLDLQGLHRVHGFGFQWQGIGGILLARSGGGKSTLAIELLEQGMTGFLSDDTPLIGSNGSMLAFPQRIALKQRPPISGSYCRKFSRALYGEKFVIGADYFGDYVISTSTVQWLLIGSVDKNAEASVREVNRRQVLWPLLKWLVVGYETPQIWEFFLRPSVRDVVLKAKILHSRCRTALKLYRVARVALFQFSSDSTKSRLAFEGFFASLGRPA